MVAAKKKVAKPAKAPVVAKLPVGRPTKNTPELRQEICDRLSKGEPLAQICRDAWMPHDNKVREWMAKDAEFSGAIAHARELGFDVIAGDCLRIADDGTNDYMEKLTADGVIAPSLNAEHIQRSKLRVETRLKLLAKWDPKRYGERQQVDVNDVTPPRPIEEVRARLAALQAKANGH